MRIGFDARAAGLLTGIGCYTDNLLTHLLRVAPDNDYYLFSDKGFAVNYLKSLPHQRIVWKTNHGRQWEQLFVPYKTWRHKLELYHCLLNHGLPLWTTCRFVVTIHDLVQFHFPEQYRILPGQVMENYPRRVAWTAKKASLIITPSESSKKDIIKFLGCSSDRIRVIPYGLDERFRPLDRNISLARVRRKFPGITKKFILYVGDLSYRKNVGRLLQAFTQVRANLSTSVQLVLVHNRNALVDLSHRVRELGLDSSVVFIENVSDDLIGLYNAAQVFIYPSLYEGFGLPALEAMACGTPVITSKVSSLPEVTGNAVLLVDPYNIDEIAQALCRLLNDEQLRLALRDRGLEQAQKFSWKKAARQTLNVYSEVYSS